VLRLGIDIDSPLPAYQQIIRGLKIEILAARLKPGDRLPPIRDLAKILKLNPNTVAKSYYALAEEGFIEGRQGSGYRVALRDSGLDGLRRSMLDGEVKEFLDRAFSLGATVADIRDSIERMTRHE
jgi:GntR family transcriptional regulator